MELIEYSGNGARDTVFQHRHYFSVVAIILLIDVASFWFTNQDIIFSSCDWVFVNLPAKKTPISVGICG